MRSYVYGSYFNKGAARLQSLRIPLVFDYQRRPETMSRLSLNMLEQTARPSTEEGATGKAS